MGEQLDDLPKEQLEILLQLQLGGLAMSRLRKKNDPMEHFYSRYELQEVFAVPEDLN